MVLVMSLSKLFKKSFISALSIPVVLSATTASVYALNTGPVPIVGAALKVESISIGPDVRWIKPGVRPLDPKVFGTPQAPLGFEPDVGLPIDQRGISPDGTAWTTTLGPTPMPLS